MEDREIPVYIATGGVVVGVILYVALVMGLFGNPNDGPDGPLLLPPDTIILERGDSAQTYPTWMTEFHVTGLRGETSYPLANLTFSVVAGGDAVFEDVVVTFHDLDGDGNATPGDVIEVTNMTDDVNGADLVVHLDGEAVTSVGIGWNVNDPLIYSAFLYWNYPCEPNGSRWDTNFSVTHLRLEGVSPSNLSFDVVGEDGGPLDEAALVFWEYREEGVLSDFDRVLVLGMTEDYQRARVRMFLDGTLVAMGTIPQWIF